MNWSIHKGYFTVEKVLVGIKSVWYTIVYYESGYDNIGFIITDNVSLIGWW